MHPPRSSTSRRTDGTETACLPRRTRRRQGRYIACCASGLLAAALLSASSGCTWVTYLGTDPRGSELGRTYYVGGAGPLGHVGTLDVPKGLRRAGYRGSLETFGWQSIVGGTLRDQMDRPRNEAQAHRLARRMEAYLRRYPGRKINIVALSAGTGIATWALEAMPADLHVHTVVFLSSSLSCDYDLSAALPRIQNKLYNFYSPDDPILRYGVPLTGSVDRQTRDPILAGLVGFDLPEGASNATAALYAEQVRNMPYRKRYQRYGYRGLHMDATALDFVELVIAPLLLDPPRPVSPFDQRAIRPDPPVTAGQESGVGR